MSESIQRGQRSIQRGQQEAHHMTAAEVQEWMFMSRLTDLLDQLNTNMAIVQQEKNETPFNQRLDENGLMYNWEVFFEKSCELVMQIEQLVQNKKDQRHA
jgi:predicted naringenin-chalcone synthase